jgi:predicted N-formylglutamate amidohydrolase
MIAAGETIPGADTRILIVCDHASNRVPEGYSLGVPDAVLETHIAVDIGAAALSRALAAALRCPAILGAVSRLVADFNRATDAPGLAPEESDGVPIPGNRAMPVAERARREALHREFHAFLDSAIARAKPALIVSVHSFTPALASSPRARPWPIGILWNRDDRAARVGLAALAQEPGLGGPVGANEPYSGRALNHTMDRHAEARGIPYLGIEVRQDEIGNDAGVARWADILVRTVRHTLAEVG